MANVESALKVTPFHQAHIDLGAKMVPFAGFDMPVQYEGLKIEHQAVREDVGVFDVSHMGEFFIEGPGSLEFLQKVTSNDVAKLVDGKVQYSCMPNGKGGIVDDLLVYRFSEERYMLVVNASNIDKDWNWLQQYRPESVTMSNKSDDYALLAVQGPNASKAMQSLTQVDLEGMKYYTFEEGVFAGEKLIVSATGYTGAGGFELYIPKDKAMQVWNALMELPHKITPAGLGARDTLRLEMGFCLYGNDIDDTTSPISAGLGWITKFTKDFIDRDVLEDHKANGTDERLVAFELIDRGIPRQGYEIVDADGNVCGRVTSGTMSPSTGKAIGMGYVKSSMKAIGTEFFVAIRNKQLKAEVVKLPFYKQ